MKEYVYKIFIDNRLIYIGKSTNPAKRFLSHVQPAWNNTVNCDKDLAIYVNMYIAKGIYPKCVVVKSFLWKENKAGAYERVLIIRNSNKTPLFNKDSSINTMPKQDKSLVVKFDRNQRRDIRKAIFKENEKFFKKYLKIFDSNTK
jgi:GIY-YIG catalytic domain